MHYARAALCAWVHIRVAPCLQQQRCSHGYGTILATLPGPLASFPQIRNVPVHPAGGLKAMRFELDCTQRLDSCALMELSKCSIGSGHLPGVYARSNVIELLANRWKFGVITSLP